MATIKRRQFLVGHEVAAPRRLRTLTYRRPLLVRQAKHVATPAFDFVDRLLDLTEQFVRQRGDAFEEILKLRVHGQKITCDVAKIHSTAFNDVSPIKPKSQTRLWAQPTLRRPC